MSRTFTAASDESLHVDSCPVTAYPFTLAAWCYSATDANQTVIQVCDKDVENKFSLIGLRSTANGHTARAFQHTYGTGTLVTAETSSQWSASTWHHACGVFTNDTSRAVFLDGGSKGDETSTTSGAVSDHDRIAIGRNMDSSADGEFDGSIAEAAIWNVALTDAEAAILGAGYSPLCVRPGNLVFYCPLIRDDDEDLVGGLSMTADNTPTIAVHPRIIYPARPQIITAPTGGTTAFTRSGLHGGFAHLAGGMG